MQEVVKTYRRELLILEFCAIFIGIPVSFAYFSSVSPVFVLVSLGIMVIIYLNKNDNFDKRSYYSLVHFSREKLRILSYFSVAALLMFAFTKNFYPHLQFFCIKENFKFWCMLMVVYPLFSVYPQELIFRAFIFTRYRELVGSERQST